MTRGEKTKRFLIGGALFIGGLLALFSGISTWLLYATIAILAFFGVIFLSEKSSRMPGIVSLFLGGLFLASIYFTWGSIIYLFGALSLVSGGYISYDTYKKINSY